MVGGLEELDDLLEVLEVERVKCGRLIGIGIEDCPDLAGGVKDRNNDFGECGGATGDVPRNLTDVGDNLGSFFQDGFPADPTAGGNGQAGMRTLIGPDL